MVREDVQRDRELSCNDAIDQRPRALPGSKIDDLLRGEPPEIFDVPALAAGKPNGGENSGVPLDVPMRQASLPRQRGSSRSS